MRRMSLLSHMIIARLATALLTVISGVLCSTSITYADLFGYDVPRGYAVGDSPKGVFVWDFDDDGDLDIAVANDADGTISILENNGSGVYTASGSVSVKAHPYSIAGGDFDSDGDLDLAVAHNTPIGDIVSVSILLNDGDGSFSLDHLESAASLLQIVLSCDLDRDGDSDLVVSDFVDDSVMVLKGDGNGSFANPEYYTKGGEWQDGKFSVAIGDLNGDAWQDIICAITYNSVEYSISILWNNHAGGLSAPQRIHTGSPSQTVSTADLNNDGNSDLIASSYYEDSLTVIENLGGHNFGDPVKYSTAEYVGSIYAADLNGDSYADIVLGNGPGSQILTYLNRGDGTLAPGVVSTVTDPRFIGGGEGQSQS